MKKLHFILGAFALMLSLNSQAQIFISSDDFGPSNPLDCDSLADAGITNFYDMGGNYTPNMDETITLCPELALGSKIQIAFAINAGFEYSIDPTDTLYVFDGPTTTSPLLGAFNSGTNPTGMNVMASFENNPSGCLTVRFVSDGAAEATGWIANISCGNPPQPFEPHLEAFINGTGPNVLNPLDTGYVNMCFGDSVLIVAKPDFPYSLENAGTGYSQTADNCTYTWSVGGVGIIPTQNDSIWFTPPARAGYYIDLRIRDQFPQLERITCKVRVSQQPLFTGAGPLEDTVCMGEQTVLLGGVTATDTVGVQIPSTTFNNGGVFAGLTALPDGTGVQYETTIPMSGFQGGTVTSGDDIVSVCMAIEHSYSGDLEILLTCPNGTSTPLMNFFGAGMEPGGCTTGTVTFLGNDTGIDGGAPGSPFWTYCFSEVNATLGTICEESTTNTIQNDYSQNSMDPNGVYEPDGNFSEFIGCPLDGPWTITVQDNLGQDDGYIFEWSIQFASNLYPDPETYQNTIVTEFWSNDPTIVGGQNDTSIVVIPTQPGNHPYVYNVVDDYGCSFDTTVYLYTLPLPTIFDDTIACFFTYNVEGTTSYEGGVWSASDTCVHFSSLTAPNPVITSTVPGTYTVTFTDNACGHEVSAEIYFEPFVYTQVLDTNICEGSTYVIYALEDPRALAYNWNTGATGTTLEVSGPGEYIVTASNICHHHTDTATIGIKECDIQAPNVLLLSSQNGNNLFFVNYEGIQKFNCIIVNRWGNVIYEYDDPAGTWNGHTLDGKEVEEGTYFYTIVATKDSGEELTKHGFIQVYK